MERRSFFRTLAIGILSAPVIAKSLTVAKQPKWKPNPAWNVAEYDVIFSHEIGRLQQAICDSIAKNDPYAQLLQPESGPWLSDDGWKVRDPETGAWMTLDLKPIRFNA